MEQIIMPKLNSKSEEGIIGTWYKQQGEIVKINEPILEVEIDKISVEITTPAEGILDAVCYEQGDKVPCGTTLAMIRSNNEEEKTNSRKLKTKIYYTIDSGLHLFGEKTGIAVDGIFLDEEMGWSKMPPSLVEDMKKKKGIFEKCDGLVFTHYHTDHFNEEYVKMAMAWEESPMIYTPYYDYAPLEHENLSGGIERFVMGEFEIYSIPSIHDGKGYEKEVHRSLLIVRGEEQFFIAGDAVLSEELLNQVLELSRGPVTAGFFNCYQILSISQNHFIPELGPERIMLYHLPFPEDDRFHYFDIARLAKRRYPKTLPELIQLEPMSWYENQEPDWWKTR